MAETIDYVVEERTNSWLWAGYAFTLLAILAYIFSEFLALPLALIIAMFALGTIMLIAGYGRKARKEVRVETKRQTFRRREF